MSEPGAYSVDFAIDERELVIDGRMPLTVDLGIGIDEEVQGRSLLGGRECQMPAAAELQPVLIVMAEEVCVLGRILRRLAGVHGHPAPVLDIELGPAMVTGDLARAAIRRQRQPDGEPGRDADRAPCR